MKTVEYPESNLVAFGVDIGGTTIKAGFVDAKGLLLFQTRIETAKLEDGFAFLRWLGETFLAGKMLIGQEKEMLPYIGIGFPGSVCEQTRRIRLTNISWPEFYFPKSIEMDGQTYTCLIANDGNLAALGEYISRNDTPLTQLLFVGIGTGVGGGWIREAQIFTGASGSGCEIGHITICNDLTFPCGCGAYGCLESIVSSLGIANLTRKFLNETLHPASFFARRNESKDHRAAYDFYIESLVIGLKNAVVCFDPELIVIGGGIARSAHIFLPDLKEKFAEAVYPRQQSIMIESSKIGVQAGMIGAAFYPFLS